MKPRFPMSRLALAVGTLLSGPAFAHVEYYDLNQGAQILDLTPAGKAASTAQYGTTPAAVIALGGVPANGLGIIAVESDRPLNDSNLWNTTNQSYTGNGSFSGVTYTPGSSTATVDVNDVTDFGWGDGTKTFLGDSHKVDFFNFRLSHKSTVTISWNVDDGAGSFLDSAFSLYSGVLNYQAHDTSGKETANPKTGLPNSTRVQDALDGPTTANGNAIPVDAQGIASAFRDTTSAFATGASAGVNSYLGQYNSLGNWGQSNDAGNWGNIAFLKAVNHNANPNVLTSGSSTIAEATLETLTLVLEPGNYTIAASGALGALANVSVDTLGAAVSGGLTGLHGHLTFTAVSVDPVSGGPVSGGPVAGVPVAAGPTPTISGNLAVSLKAQRSVKAGKKITYQLVAKNLSRSSTLSAASVSLSLSGTGNATWLKWPGSCSATATEVQCSLGDLKKRKKRQLSFKAVPAVESLVGASAQLSGTQDGTLVGASPASSTTTVKPAHR